MCQDIRKRSHQFVSRGSNTISPASACSEEFVNGSVKRHPTICRNGDPRADGSKICYYFQWAKNWFQRRNIHKIGNPEEVILMRSGIFSGFYFTTCCKQYCFYTEPTRRHSEPQDSADGDEYGLAVTSLHAATQGLWQHDHEPSGQAEAFDPRRRC